MVNIKTLLPDLKELVKELAEDLLARAIGNPEIDAGLREAFTQIEKGGRTAQAYEVWREDYLDQVAVAWVLACVFVRFLEDNHLIDECWLAGEGERRKLAEDTHELFFRQHPHDTDREYFQHVFHEVGKIPPPRTCSPRGRRRSGRSPRRGDAAMKLLAFWREMQPETGHLKRSFEVEDGDTRFLGDLYQELSEKAKKKYALLQTPVFVEEFILDRTLNPAIDEFGLDTVRMIDPTCGSGHFLLGGFARLFRPLDEAGEQRDRRRPEGARRRLGRGHQPVRRGDCSVPADRCCRASLRDQAVEAGTGLEHPPGDRRQPALRQQAGLRTASGCSIAQQLRVSLRFRTFTPSKTGRLCKRFSVKATTLSSATRHTSP